MRKYKNKAEQAFAKEAKENGWEITKQGYPDFICYKKGMIMLVEVKPIQFGKLKKSQSKFMNTLKQLHDVKCYRWSPDKNWLK